VRKIVNVDKELDKKQVNILKKGNVILEGRLSGWLAYKNNISSFKVFIDADIKTRSNRIVNRENGDLKKDKKRLSNVKEVSLLVIKLL